MAAKYNVKEELRRLAFCPSFSSGSTSNDFSFEFPLADSDGRTTDGSSPVIVAKTFKFRELAVATRNFNDACQIGFGCLYKGKLLDSNHVEVVAIKIFDRNGQQGNREFLAECMTLSLLHHPNLINLIGYCADEDRRLVVYEYMPLGSLYNHLHEPMPGRKHLDWNTRMKIAAGVAKGLEYLHHKASPPVIHRDLKSTKILPQEGYHPKIFDFGFAKFGPIGDKTHVSGTRVIGTFGYLAPEYAMMGRLTPKADVYSFGVVLLEIISRRKAVNILKTGVANSIVKWARPLFGDRRNFAQIVDPALKGRYPLESLYQAIAVAAMCLQEEAELRPTMVDVALSLTYLSSQK